MIINLIFYTWYELGDFYFSMIPQDWRLLDLGEELPFGCTVNKVDDLKVIIQNFVNDPEKGAIEFSELQDVYKDDDEDDDPKNYVLDVWSTILK